MMMTYMKSVKRTFENWFSENRRLGYILIGMIGLPLGLFAVAGVIALCIIILSFFFGQFFGTLVFLQMLVGAFAGWVWGMNK